MTKTEFMELYEELSRLNESKADTQKLIDFAGEDLANRFLAVRARLKAPENDLYYWIKHKTVDELETVVMTLENIKLNTNLKKEVTGAGAQLVNENDSWRVYHITSYEAARVYGRDTKWCITGIDNNGDFYWKDYHDVRGVEFYFFIAKQHYDPRGNTSKYALAIWPKKRAYEIYSQQDDLVPLSQVPFIKDLEIPGVDFTKLKPYKLPATPKCRYCGFEIYICDDADYRMTDNDTKFYHPVCWYEKFKPDQVEDLTSLFINGIGIARVNVTEPYHEALTRIINTIKSLNPQQKQSLILSWDKEKPFKPLVSIRAGKLTINDISAGDKIEQVFNN